VIRTHPVTGREAIFVNRAYTRHFEGMTEEESSPLVEMLYNHSQKPEFTGRLHWTKDTLAIWDNRVTMHHAMDDDFSAMFTGCEFRRVMHRATFVGETPV
jgi:taurine dioxygenase